MFFKNTSASCNDCIAASCFGWVMVARYYGYSVVGRNQVL